MSRRLFCPFNIPVYENYRPAHRRPAQPCFCRRCGRRRPYHSQHHPGRGYRPTAPPRKGRGHNSRYRDCKKVFEKFDSSLKITQYINDGAHVKPGDIAFVVEGPVRSLLQTERVMLNIMQRMSGIATMTARYQERLAGLKTKVLDTRKTTPGMRMLEKMDRQNRRRRKPPYRIV